MARKKKNPLTPDEIIERLRERVTAGQALNRTQCDPGCYHAPEHHTRQGCIVCPEAGRSCSATRASFRPAGRSRAIARGHAAARSYAKQIRPYRSSGVSTHLLAHGPVALPFGQVAPARHHTKRASAKLRQMKKPMPLVKYEEHLPAVIEDEDVKGPQGARIADMLAGQRPAVLAPDLPASAVEAVKGPKCRRSAKRLGRCSWRKANKSRRGRVRKLKPGRLKAGRKHRGYGIGFIRGAARFCSTGGRGMAKHCRGQKLRRRRRVMRNPGVTHDLVRDFMDHPQPLTIMAGFFGGMIVPAALKLSPDKKLLSLAITAGVGVLLALASEALKEGEGHAGSAAVGAGAALLLRGGAMMFHKPGPPFPIGITSGTSIG